jgi:L-rhamnose mutarotase
VERLFFTFDLAPGQEAEYERRHREIWPDLVAAIKDAGFSNYTLFRRELQVYAYAECEPSVAAALDKLERTEVNQRWSVYIRSLMTRAVDDAGNLFTADEVWHLD